MRSNEVEVFVGDRQEVGVLRLALGVMAQAERDGAIGIRLHMTVAPAVAIEIVGDHQHGFRAVGGHRPELGDLGRGEGDGVIIRPVQDVAVLVLDHLYVGGLDRRSAPLADIGASLEQ